MRGLAPNAVITRNLTLYAVGLALAVTGALGLAKAIELAPALSAGLFLIGLAVIIAVHHHLNGPF